MNRWFGFCYFAWLLLLSTGGFAAIVFYPVLNCVHAITVSASVDLDSVPLPSHVDREAIRLPRVHYGSRYLGIFPRTTDFGFVELGLYEPSLHRKLSGEDRSLARIFRLFLDVRGGEIVTTSDPSPARFRRIRYRGSHYLLRTHVGRGNGDKCPFDDEEREHDFLQVRDEASGQQIEISDLEVHMLTDHRVFPSKLPRAKLARFLNLPR